jgi:hypothetical protein
MKKFIPVFVVLTLMALVAKGQEESSLKERRIYLWDVTLSTKGYEASTKDFTGKNIYDKVESFLRREINSITNPLCEIYVIPFQDKVLDAWYVRADDNGKKDIIQRIKKYKDHPITNQITRTNISGPIDYAVENLVNNNVRTILYVLTDGAQNYPNAIKGKQAFIDCLNRNEWLKNDNLLLCYFAMTDDANDEGIIKMVKKGGGIVVGEEGLNVTWLEIDFPSKVRFNIKDDSVMNISFKAGKDVRVPSGMKFHIETPADSPIRIDEDVVLDNLCLPVKMEGKYDYAKLKYVLPEESVISLSVSLCNAEEIKEKYQQIPLLLRPTIGLVLVNKPEKKMTITLKPSENN